MSDSPRGHLWTIILAGGEGVRLRQLTRALHGEECPKQFAMIHGGRSLLQWTVARALRWSEPEHILVVVAAERAAQAQRQLAGQGPVDVVAQPSNRGTGPGILLPLARVMARDPGARVVVMPSDHYVRDEARFEHSIRLASLASDDQVALIGAVPDHAETQYGWIVTGRTLAAQRGSVVSHFCEKPPAVLAERLLRQGALWNTFIMAGAAYGRRRVPFLGTRQRALAGGLRLVRALPRRRRPARREGCAAGDLPLHARVRLLAGPAAESPRAPGRRSRGVRLVRLGDT
jgi:mannose-1-phosphate guanylyltransferase